MQTSDAVRDRRNITGNEKEFIRLNIARNVRISASGINLDIVNCLFHNNEINVSFLPGGMKSSDAIICGFLCADVKIIRRN